MTAADIGEGGEQFLVCHSDLVGQRQQKMLRREVLVVEFATDLVGPVEQRRELAPHPRLAAVGLGQFRDRFLGGIAQLQGGDAHLLQQRQHDAFFLAEQGQKEVIRRHFGVARRARIGQRDVHRILRFKGPTVRIESHDRDVLLVDGEFRRCLQRPESRRKT